MGKNIVNGKESGVLLIGALFFITIIGLGLSAFANVWSTSIKRDKEAELRYILSHYKIGVEVYRIKHKKDPASLQEMYAENVIRKIYPDPFTNEKKWEIEIKDKKISNISSSSEQTGLNGIKYNEWKW